MKRKPVKLPLYISSQEMGTLVKKIRKDRHRLGLAIMAYGGLRVSEMCSIRVKDLHLARGFMRVTGKGGRERVVPLSSYLQRKSRATSRDTARPWTRNHISWAAAGHPGITLSRSTHTKTSVDTTSTATPFGIHSQPPCTMTGSSWSAYPSCWGIRTLIPR